MKSLDKHHSPRAFVKYVYKSDRVPYPLPFVQGIFNSFPGKRKRLKFLQKFYQLLLHQMFPIKERKLLVYGDSNSGKTSWFYVFQGIIGTDHIAGVTQESQFAGHMINESTEIVFMDEWSSNSLSCEEAKRVLQGGLIMLSQKHKSAKKIKYKSGFFITTNKKPRFGKKTEESSESEWESNDMDSEDDENIPGDKDNRAVYKRLRCFRTKSLPNEDSSVGDWLRNHCMEVFHYCSEVLKTTPLFDSCSNQDVFKLKRDEERMGAAYNDYDGLAESLLADSDFETDSSEDAEETSSESEEEALNFTSEDMDLYFLGADESDPKRWKKDHEYFTTDIKRVDPLVRKLTMLTDEDWSKLPINKEDLKRYNIRKANSWTGVDSFYEAWLKRKGSQESQESQSTTLTQRISNICDANESECDLDVIDTTRSEIFNEHIHPFKRSHW
ncbi:uncharacterized protein [Clytia hemisphaerica]|uniref:uncharacterized protein n=1 Tax=Clytia hemisphaerica TaxID=252671 RepID=UPI0034D42141